MIDYKVNVTTLVPVRLLDASSNPVPGVVFSQVTVSGVHSDGSTFTFSPSAIQWTEVTTGAFLNQGVYTAQIPGTNMNVVGMFVYAISVSASAAKAFIGTGKIIAADWDSIDATISSRADQITATQLRRLAEGRWKIWTVGPDTNRLVMYSADGSSVLQKWNLFDNLGIPTVTNIFERVPVNAIP